MTYWFKPWTHWHEISRAAFYILMAAGFDRDVLVDLRPGQDPR